MTITTDCTRLDLEEAMAHLVATLRRLPTHYTDKRAELHGEIDLLLSEWQRADT